MAIEGNNIIVDAISRIYIYIYNYIGYSYFLFEIFLSYKQINKMVFMIFTIFIYFIIAYSTINEIQYVTVAYYCSLRI